MLFSNDQIAQFINGSFEATWENVREVPIVTIDFGGGHVVNRTLNGNIATYLCTSSGDILDVLPGIYEPVTYRSALEEFVKLNLWANEKGTDVADRAKSHHLLQAKALAQGQPPLKFEAQLNITKSKIERSTKFVLSPQPLPNVQPDEPTAVTTTEYSKDDIARWKVLAEDTQINETERRLLIHRHLAGMDLAKPVDLKKWLYREVLHADLDDPYLGLGEMLFANYPFDDR